MYLFSNILGVFGFNENFVIVDEILFKNLEDYKNNNRFIDKIKSEHNNIKVPDEETLKKILLYFKNNKCVDVKMLYKLRNNFEID